MQELEKIREGLRFTKFRSLIICPIHKAFFYNGQLQPDVMAVTYSTYWEKGKIHTKFRHVAKRVVIVFEKVNIW
jgi:hypothetical protein